MKAEVTENTLVCDEPNCGWTMQCEFSDVPTWHKKPCPKCGKGEIISDADMVVFHSVVAVIAIDNTLDPEGKQPRFHLRINTAGLRATQGGEAK